MSIEQNELCFHLMWKVNKKLFSMFKQLINIKFQLNFVLNSQKTMKISFIHSFYPFHLALFMQDKVNEITSSTSQTCNQIPVKAFSDLTTYTISQVQAQTRVQILFTASVIVYVRVLIRIPLLLFHVYLNNKCGVYEGCNCM